MHFPAPLLTDTPLGAIASFSPASDKPVYANFRVVAGVAHLKERNRLKKKHTLDAQNPANTTRFCVREGFSLAEHRSGALWAKFGRMEGVLG